MKKLNRVLQKIENDYQEIKTALLAKETNEVFDSACKIFFINEVYDILTNSFDYTSEIISAILCFKGNILEQVYYEWLSSDYSYREMFDDIIKESIDMITRRYENREE